MTRTHPSPSHGHRKISRRKVPTARLALGSLANAPEITISRFSQASRLPVSPRLTWRSLTWRSPPRPWRPSLSTSFFISSPPLHFSRIFCQHCVSFHILFILFQVQVQVPVQVQVQDGFLFFSSSPVHFSSIPYFRSRNTNTSSPWRKSLRTGRPHFKHQR